MVGLLLKNTTLCGKILHFVVKHSVLWYNITFLWYNITFCSTFVVYLWYICDIFVVFFAMGCIMDIIILIAYLQLSYIYQIIERLAPFTSGCIQDHYSYTSVVHVDSSGPI